jgi:hypothetical protein
MRCQTLSGTAAASAVQQAAGEGQCSTAEVSSETMPSFAGCLVIVLLKLVV